MTRGRHVVEIRAPRIVGDLAYIPLTQGREAVIDVADLALVAGRNWYAARHCNTFYATSHQNRPAGYSAALKMHRLILQAQTGDIIDHRDGDGLNNRRENLRLATSAQNSRNRSRFPNNTSGFKGVSWDDDLGMWRARITFDHRVIHLGRFNTREAAHAAYAKAAQRLHGEFACIA